VVPAVAGPFDLGNVVVRSRVEVDRHTAKLKMISDPLPTILQGIPLDVRDVRVSIDRWSTGRASWRSSTPGAAATKSTWERRWR
jgi:hypothetical protein